MAFGKKGFEKFLVSGEFYDLTLVMPGNPPKEYRVHKLILASNSGEGRGDMRVFLL
jgi:hypothetical protein